MMSDNNTDKDQATANNALADEEVETATGGAWFRACPKGHFEAAFRVKPSSDCRNNCPYFKAESTNVKYDCTFFYTYN